MIENNEFHNVIGLQTNKFNRETLQIHNAQYVKSFQNVTRQLKLDQT